MNYSLALPKRNMKFVHSCQKSHLKKNCCPIKKKAEGIQESHKPIVKSLIVVFSFKKLQSDFTISIFPEKIADSANEFEYSLSQSKKTRNEVMFARTQRERFQYCVLF